tara:strand:+ start:12682 stop:13521 length:840 start_codon:yes stop_codon:yes gene_type:complete
MNKIKPMKAHKYRADRVIKPGYVQPKLNGLRAIWNGECLNTYNMEVWKPGILDHISNAIREFEVIMDEGSLYLDGEIYVHGKSLQWINSRASVNRVTPHAQEHLIEFHVFDIANKYKFVNRKTQLSIFKDHLPHNCPIKFVDTYYNDGSDDMFFRLFRKEGYEGMIYRAPNEPYGFLEDCRNKENRWWKIMKRKYWEDMDAVILSCNEGKGDMQGMLGAFTCRGENGVTFNVGSGEALTHASRDRFWRQQPVGLTCKIKYEMLSDSGVPLKPILEAVYE